MNIAWIKVSLPIEIDYRLADTNTGVDDRAGFMEAFANRGHRITIYTGIKPHDETLFSNKKEEIKKRPWMYWVKNIRYKPTKFPKKDDVLIVECGADTTNFGCKHTKQTCIRRFAELVDSFEGPVFYLHRDPTMPFQFKQFTLKRYPWGHKMNGYSNPIPGKTTKIKNWAMWSQWGTFDELFKNKTTVLVAPVTKPELLPELFNVGEGYAGRTGYGDLQEHINFETCSPAYDSKLFEYRQFKTRGLKGLSDEKVLYTGGDRGRRASFRRLCSGVEQGVLATGLWKDEKFNDSLDNVELTGWLDTRREVQELINRSLCTIQVTTTKGEKLGWVTAKTFEAAYGRSFLLMDKNIDQGNRFVIDDYFLVKDAREVSEKVKGLLTLSKSERRDFHDVQIEHMKVFDWDTVAKEMEVLFKRYGA